MLTAYVCCLLDALTRQMLTPLEPCLRIGVLQPRLPGVESLDDLQIFSCMFKTCSTMYEQRHL